VTITRTGRLLLAASVALVAIGAALGQHGVAGLGLAGLVAVAAAAVVVAEAPSVSLERSVEPGEVERGRPAEAVLRFRGTSSRGRPFTAIERVDGERRSAAMSALRAGEQATLAYELDTSRRGTLVTGPLLLRRTDPLGLVVAERRLAGTASVQVRPRRLPVDMLPSGRWRDLEGPTREISRGTATFHQLRDYVPGDDLRHVHWRATARTGDLVVREHVDTTKPEVVVILDDRAPAMTPADFEEGVDVAASVLDAADRAGFPTRLVLAAGQEVDGDRPDLPHLDRLTVVRQTEGRSLLELADALRARGRSLLVVTGTLDAADLRMVSRIAQGFSPAILVSVVADRDAPFVAPPGLTGISCGSAAGFVAAWEQQR